MQGYPSQLRKLIKTPPQTNDSINPFRTHNQSTDDKIYRWSCCHRHGNRPKAALSRIHRIPQPAETKDRRKPELATQRSSKRAKQRSRSSVVSCRDVAGDPGPWPLDLTVDRTLAKRLFLNITKTNVVVFQAMAKQTPHPWESAQCIAKTLIAMG